jgi:hypothetical protein
MIRPINPFNIVYVTMKMLVYSVTTRTFHKIYVVFTIFAIFDHNMTLKEVGTL